MKKHLADLFRAALQGVAPDLVLPVSLERPKKAEHGDYACNLAMQIARSQGGKPREIAERLLAALPVSPWIEQCQIAGAGFINIYLNHAARRQVVQDILAAGAAYGRSTIGNGRALQVEFVSANPTGPLHVGHGRGAAYGASLANILEAVGFAVTREFYINDAGRQMDILALSTWLRYLEMSGVLVPFPANAYQGYYVRAMAEQIRHAHGDRYIHEPWTILNQTPDSASDPEGHLDGLIANAKRLLGQDYAYIHDFALTEQLGDCRNDLLEFGVQFDNWFSEQSLFASGMVARAIATLEKNGHLYEADGARWFRSTAFGDEKDRVVQRENGQYTYFASDIAYHLNKFERGFHKIIDVWGADHHGYVSRIKGSLSALGLDPAVLDVALVQFAVLYRGKEKLPMSTRSGSFVTLRDLRSEVGNDAARFFYVLRKSDQHLDFDLELAKARDNENPVYYIQYAHARICSVFAQWGGEPDTLLDVDLSTLVSPRETTLLSRLADYPETIENAAREYAPHLVAYYLKELAAELHSYYNAEQFLVADETLKRARLALILATRVVLQSGLALLGVSSPEKM